MGFDVTNGTRLRSTGDEALRGGGEQGDGLRDGRAHVADEQHQTGQDALHEGDCVGSIALTRAGGKIGVVMSRAIQGEPSRVQPVSSERRSLEKSGTEFLPR